MPIWLEKFVDALPIPTKLASRGKLHGETFYQVTMREVRQQLHRDLPPTRVWTYEGTYPGPTIEVRRHEHVAVKWMSALPQQHLLPVDKTVHGATPDQPEVRAVVHVHGANVQADSDGHPEAWFTAGFAKTGPTFVHKVYHYTNNQPAASLWYHDHALGITRLNVYAGLAGVYLIRDELEDSLNLPRGRFEIPLLFQDRTFNEDGSLFYPREGDAPVPGVDPSVVPEFFGDTILVNGKAWPFLDVEPRKYRFRIYNGSNSRFFRLTMSSGQPFVQIGTDSGFLERPVTVKTLLLGPAERADVIVDFKGHRSETITVFNDAQTPFPMGADVDPETTGLTMQFRVRLPLRKADRSEIPNRLASLETLPPADRVRTLTLVEETDEFGRLLPLLNGMMWHEPVTENPRLGDTEIWRLVNLTPDTHPIHVHLVHFRILDRQPFDVARFQSTGRLEFTGPAVPPDANEAGFKDTLRAAPEMVTRLIARFVDFAGDYVWHCHILEHEDHDMMRPYVVRPAREEPLEE